MPQDEEITFADHVGRFYARRYGYPPMVGRVIGYLLVCDPKDQTIAELSEALLASRSAITGALNVLERTDAIRRSRAAGERMDRVRLDLSSPQAKGFDVTEYQQLADLAREGLQVLDEAPVERRAVLLEMAAFADFLVDRTRVLQQEWEAHRDALPRLGRVDRVASPMATKPTSDPMREGSMRSSFPSSALTACGVRKAYGNNVVLDGVDLTVATGSVFALLGPNGAGKTTMVNILATLLEPDDGEIRVAGHDLRTDPEEVRGSIGVTGQFSAVDNLLTGEENLRLMADLRHLGRGPARQRVGELLTRFELLDAARQPVSTYSGGMKRRLDLAMTLVGDPRLIFLDEPTTGLDPRSRRTMWDLIRELVADGVTILLTTQYLDEADQLADVIAILDNGRIVAQGTPGELKRRLPGSHVQLHFADPRAMDCAARLLDIGRGNAETLTLQIPGDSSVVSLRALLDRLEHGGIEADRLSIHEADLDDVFFALTGQPTGQLEPQP